MAEERHEEVTRREEISGTRGGAVEAYPARPYVPQEEAEAGFWLKDRVRWGPIWAGLVIAFSVQLILTAIGIALGIQGLIPSPAELSGEAVTTFGIWMAFSALVSLFLGGLAAARFAGIAGKLNGMWNGVVLWGLAIVLGTLATSLGLTGILGSLSRGIGQIAMAPDMTQAEIQNILRMTQAGAGWFILGAILALAAAALGGYIGARHEVTETGEPRTR